MSFIWQFVIFLVIQDLTGFVSAINIESEIIFLNALFSLIECLIDAQFKFKILRFDKCTNFSVIEYHNYRKINLLKFLLSRNYF